LKHPGAPPGPFLHCASMHVSVPNLPTRASQSQLPLRVLAAISMKDVIRFRRPTFVRCGGRVVFPSAPSLGSWSAMVCLQFEYQSAMRRFKPTFASSDSTSSWRRHAAPANVSFQAG
jgi:hypothetical protein